MPVDPWDYVASNYAVDDDGNRLVTIDGIQRKRCPGCPLGASSGNSDLECVHGSIQVAICIPYIQDSEAFALFRVQNTVAWQTYGTANERMQEYYVEGDYEAHNP